MAGIYIHVPFCKSKCTYCDFASYPRELNKIESYFAALYRETKARGEQLKEKTFSTVYFGGGTPSIVDANLIAGELKQIRKYFNLTKDAEITIEINPGTVDEQKIKAYKTAGINRFSIGLQTGYDDQLKRLNRIHTAKDFICCAKLLDGENISADILLGLQGQTYQQVQKTIDLCLACNIKHISMYALTAEEGTPIYTDYLNGELLSNDEVADIYDLAREYLKQHNIMRYEVSNFAVKGYESKHNLNYWQRGEYIGLGVSASSFIDDRRFTNTFSIDEYINAIIYNKFPEIASDIISGEDAYFEYIMLHLRTEKGMNVAEFNSLFSLDFKQKYKKVIEKKQKYTEFNGDYFRIKPEYLYVQNSILLDFMQG